MKATISHPWRLAVAAVLSFGLFAWPVAGGASLVGDSASITFSGQASVVQAAVLGTALPSVSDTGPLPSSGGALEASLLTVNQSLGAGGTLNAEVAHAVTVGQGDRSRSEASVAALSLTVAGQSISADFLMARAVAQCTSTGPSVSGGSELASLMINGQTISVTGAPNQTITLPANSGRVVINEQSSSVMGNSGTIDVNALHVTVNNPLGGAPLADVIVAHTHADISCEAAPACTSARDFVTGGGWIPSPSTPGAKANFAVAGGFKNGAPWGHLLYIDHGNGLRVKGTGVTNYVIVSGTTLRKIFGTFDATPPNNYESDVADNGEPGRGTDTFQLSTNGNTVAPTTLLGGGNIQLHRPCQ